ncbi:Molybdenum ABC transporter, substrate-binding protein ModA [hydrothermal vent metagenome]|uniref:Molybdenum ABC transporter, substrate-binding protein ModA n=1 Tax=hydrothermal vent metagenome TaxID=652676 RepID=A0A3B0ZT61_9ZZZZ
MRISTAIFILLLFVEPGYLLAKEIRVAVASNFKAAITSVTSHFEATSDHKVTLIFGSTGKHYAQIKNGAPYDVFLAADSQRPQRLEEEGIALANSRFTYARGKIVLWSPAAGYIDSTATILKKSEFRYLAVANPRLAPYGKAAKEVLTRLKLWDSLANKMVRGENINQTFQFVKSSNAEMGFVAYSQLVSLMKNNQQKRIEGSYWEVPQSLYSPIEQQAVILKDNKAAHEFIAFIRNEQALKIIRDYGYGVP